MKNPNDSIEQSRLWLLQMHGWAQRGLELLAKDEDEEVFDQELAAEAVEALQTVFNLTEPDLQNGKRTAARAGRSRRAFQRSRQSI